MLRAEYILYCTGTNHNYIHPPNFYNTKINGIQKCSSLHISRRNIRPNRQNLLYCMYCVFSYEYEHCTMKVHRINWHYSAPYSSTSSPSLQLINRPVSVTDVILLNPFHKAEGDWIYNRMLRHSNLWCGWVVIARTMKVVNTKKRVTSSPTDAVGGTDPKTNRSSQDNNKQSAYGSTNTLNISERAFKNVSSLRQLINPLQTKGRPLYLKTQSVPRCKHFSSRL